MNNLPERINVMRVVTYNVAEVLDDIEESTGTARESISLSEVLEWVESWAENDLSCGYGHTLNGRELIYQDENGEEL